MIPDIDPRDWFSWEGVARIQEAAGAQATDEGATGVGHYFRQKEIFDELLDKRESYKERSARWLSGQRAKHTVPPNRLRDALQAIADGHNDPRSLAREVLDLLD